MTTFALRSATDRHHQARTLRREHIELLLRCAEHFAEPDRLLIEHLFHHGHSLRQVSRLLNIPVSTLHTRLRQLITRARSPLFIYVVCHLSDLPPALRQTARLIVLQGHSLRETAHRTNRSLHTIRRHLTGLQTLAGIKHD